MIISPDTFLMVEGKYVWTPERVKAAWDSAYKSLADAIGSGRFSKVVLMCGTPGAGKSTWLSSHAEEGVIYFDATLTSTKARRGVLAKVRGALPVEVVVIDTDFQTCMARNASRTTDRKVPVDTLRRMWDTLQGDMPHTREGFSKVTVVR